MQKTSNFIKKALNSSIYKCFSDFSILKILVIFRKTFVFLRIYGKYTLLITKFGLVIKLRVVNMLNNYCCGKCFIVKQAEIIPNTDGFDCPNGGFHFWMDMGTVGSVNYQCDKCGTMVSSGSIPTLFGCGLNGYHHWEKKVEINNLIEVNYL